MQIPAYKKNIQRFKYLLSELEKHQLFFLGENAIFDETLPERTNRFVCCIDVKGLPLNGYDILKQIPRLGEYVHKGRAERLKKAEQEIQAEKDWFAEQNKLQPRQSA